MGGLSGCGEFDANNPNLLQSIYTRYRTGANSASKKGVYTLGGVVLGLTSPLTKVDPELLGRAGAFAWWYLDLVNERGDGVVLIWSWGLPFLPGIASSARKGDPQVPLDRPSVNIAVYERGVARFYLLQELPSDMVSWESGQDRWRFGDCEIQFHQLGQGRGRISVELDCVVPGMAERLTGSIEAEGALRKDVALSAQDGRHVWTPVMTACGGTAVLCCGSWSVRIEGRVYHDRNSGSQPMHTLGIDRWWWGRIALPNREVIFYHLQPQDQSTDAETLVLEIDSSGRTRLASEARVEVLETRQSVYSLRWVKRLRFWDVDGREVTVQLRAGVDDSPFYQRMIVEAQCGDETGWGFAELVVPDRIDPDWMRWLVGMRVHRVQGNNSVWLPLFSGPRSGRTGRLISQFWAPSGERR